MTNQAMIVTTALAVSSLIAIAPTATASKVQITFENLAPPAGALFTSPWVAVHDGSFDTIDPGDPASLGIQIVAEEGVVGLEGITGLGPILDAAGTRPDFEDTIAGMFANSSAGANGGDQGVLFTFVGGILPGETDSVILDVNDRTVNRFFSYASMFFPSNDAFISNPEPIEIFDASGNFIGADFFVGRNPAVVGPGNVIWDSGTEINDESLMNVPFTPETVGNRNPEGGVVTVHPGFSGPPGTGGIFDQLLGGTIPFTNADFTNDDNVILARITITKVPEPTAVMGLIALSSLFWLGRRRCSDLAQ